MVEKGKGKEKISVEAGSAKGRVETNLTCIGEICFTDAGFIVKLPENANPKCAIKTAELILSGRSNVVFEIPGRGLVSKEALEQEISK